MFQITLLESGHKDIIRSNYEVLVEFTDLKYTGYYKDFSAVV